MKQGPWSVWCHVTVTVVPFTTRRVNVGGAAMSEQVEQGDKHIVITVVTFGACT